MPAPPASQTFWLDYATVDVFTRTRLEGNPLAIVRVPTNCPISQQQKQAIAREFNLSETVFLHERDQDARNGGLARWVVDIFTTEAELAFAGHPTIGTLCYIGQDERDGQGSDVHAKGMCLVLKAGLVEGRLDGDSAEAHIPHNLHVHSNTVSGAAVLASQPRDLPHQQSHWKGLGETSAPLVSVVKGMTFVLVSLPRVEGYLDRLSPHSSPIPDLPDLLDEHWSPSFCGVYYYALLDEVQPGSGPIRLRTRMIEAAVGEDPATGSAACALASYLSLQRRGESARFVYEIEQGVEMGRRSLIGVRVTLDESGDKVKDVVLSGAAVLVMEGRLRM